MSRSRRLEFGRRRMLRGILGGAAVTVGLPWLESLMLPSGQAQASTNGLYPARFGLFFWGNGNLPDRWTPIGEGTGYGLSDQLAPLDGLQDVLTVLSGLSVRVPNSIPHWSGAAGLVSGMPALGDDNDSFTVAGPTIDQVLADAIGNDTIYRSLEVGVATTNSMSYTAPYSQNPAEMEPYTFFERIFGGGVAAADGVVPPSLGYRRSVLDAVMTDIEELNGLVGASDKVRLEQHLDGVRELELRLSRLQEDPPDLDACVTPTAPQTDYPDVDGRPQLSARSRAMADLMAMAIACDQTRVFSFQYTDPLSNVLFDGASDGHHNLTHHEAGEQEEVHSITLQVMEEYAYLLQALRDIPEGDETLLDHCAVMAVSEVSEGRTHSLDEIPLLIGGSACGTLKTGTHYRSYTSENAGKAMLSVLRAFGLPAGSWGSDDVYTTDGLSAIEV